MLIVGPEAEFDMLEAYNWYEEKNQNLGKEFIIEVDLVFNIITSNPKIYMPVFENIHRSLCKRFPYAVYFSEENEKKFVLAVLHQRRNPAIWQSRV